MRFDKLCLFGLYAGPCATGSRHLANLLCLWLIFSSTAAFAGGHTVPSPDTDTDGFNDYIESRLGTDPNDATSVPAVQEDIWIDFETEVPGAFFTPPDSDAGWFRSDSSSKSGQWSLQSQPIDDAQTASVVWPVLVRDSTLRFNYWNWSFDQLVVYVDDVEVYNLGRLNPWSYNKPILELAAGYHEIRFDYQKNDFSVRYCDCARIDNIRLLDDLSDNDGVKDDWELENGLDPNDPSDAAQDPDLDGLSNLGEFENDTDPFNPDSDSDGLLDAQEVNIYGTDPNDPDTDNDGLTDGAEVDAGLDPTVPSRESDADEDGFTDYIELRLDTDPLDPDSIPVVFDTYFAGFEAGLPPNWYAIDVGDLGWFRSDADAFQGLWALESDIDVATNATVVLPVLTRESTLDFRFFSTNSSLTVYVDGRREFFSGLDGEWLEPPEPIELSAGFHEIWFQHSNANNPGNGVRLDNVYIEAVDIDEDGIPNEWERANGLDPFRKADGQQDFDGDGLVNLAEWENGTDPNDSDTDADGIEDNIELTVAMTDPTQSDTDGDSLPDGYEVDNSLDPAVSNRGQDTDGDGVDDTYEYLVGTNPQVPGAEPAYLDEYSEGFEQPDAADFWVTPDGDHVSWFRNDATAWEGSWSLESEQTAPPNRKSIISFPIRVYASEMRFRYYVNAGQGSRLRVYVDGEPVLTGLGSSWKLSPAIPLSDGYHEVSFVYEDGGAQQGCRCARIDALQIVSLDFDRDGLPDEWENEQGLDFEDPADAVLDNDSDGLSNLDEFANMTQAFIADSDSDGVLDGLEVNTYGSDPNDSDTDDDELPDGWEVENGTNPTTALDRDADNDGDGVSNSGEFFLGTDAADSNSVPPYMDNYVEGFESELPEFWQTPPAADAGWFRSDAIAWEGLWSLETEDLEQGETAEIILPVRVHESKMRIRVYRNASVSDNLVVYVDGEEVYNSGNVKRSWTYSPRVLLTEGYHEIRFEYLKNSSGSTWCDCARIDFVELLAVDLDGDSVDDQWEINNGLDPANPADALFDNDSDGLNNLAEFRNDTLPFEPDTDSDGALDGIEVITYGSDPKDIDTDDDDLPDGWEIDNGVNPTNALDRDADNDGDGVTNSGEYYLGTDASDSASVTPFVTSYVEDFEDPLPAFWQAPLHAIGTWNRSDAAAWEGNWSLVSEFIPQFNVAEIVLPVRVRESTLRVRAFRNTDVRNNIFVYVDGIEVYNTENEERSWVFSPQIPLSEGYHEIRFEYEFRWFQNPMGCNCGRIDWLEILPNDP